MRRALRGLLAAGAVAAAAGALAPAAPAADPRPAPVLELASPRQSEGFNAVGWAWPDGEHAVYRLGSIETSARYTTRGADGRWSATVFEQQTPGTYQTMMDASDDFAHQIVLEQPYIGVEGEPLGMFRFTHGADPVEIARWELTDPMRLWSEVEYRGRSADGETLYLHADRGLLPVGGASELLRWQDGALEPVEVAAGDARPASCLAGTAIGRPASKYTSTGQSGVSDDGRTLFLTARLCTDGGTTYPAHVLVWRDGETVDPSAPLDPAQDSGATFVGGARDGSLLWFTSESRLTPDDAGTTADLFAYDVERDELTRVSAAPAGADDDATVTGATVAPDGRSVWFTTDNALGADGSDGADNLFRWTPEGGTRFVLEAPRFALNLANTSGPGSMQLAWDGGALLAQTNRSLTPEAAANGIVKLYRVSADGAVACISCVAGGAETKNPQIAYASGTTDGRWDPLSISGDGRTIAFATEEALDPRDLNGTWDAYVWRDGVRSLLSTGTIPVPNDLGAESVGVGGVSRDGATAFFASFGALLPGTDAYRKLYAAQLDGAPAPVAPTPCAGDACQGPSEPLPALPGAASETFEGAGNDEQQAPRVRSFAPSWPGRGAVTRFARSGRLTLAVRGSDAGRVRVTAQARIRGAWTQVATGSRTLTRGTAKVTLRLSRPARAELKRSGRLRLRLTVRSSRVAGERSRTVVLRAAKTRGVRR